MLVQAFKSILLMSAVGSLLSVFWLCLKPITRKVFSPRWQYYIWLTVLIVMILPVHFNVPSRTSEITTVISEQSENVTNGITQNDNQVNDSQIPKQREKLSIPKMYMPQNVFNYLENVWFCVMLVIFLTKMVKYNLFLRAIHKNSINPKKPQFVMDFIKPYMRIHSVVMILNMIHFTKVIYVL